MPVTLQIEAWQVIGALLALAATLIGVIWGLLRWAAQKYEAAQGQTNERLDKITEKMDGRHETTARQLGEHAGRLQVLEALNLERKNELEKATTRWHDRLDKMQADVIDNLKRAARMGRAE